MIIVMDVAPVTRCMRWSSDKHITTYECTTLALWTVLAISRIRYFHYNQSELLKSNNKIF